MNNKLKTLKLVMIILLLWGCKDDNDKQPRITISGFSPTSGSPGTEVIIEGENFSPEYQANQVKIGTTDVEVSSSTKNSIKIVVPSDATTGKIQVATNSFTALSDDNFVVVIPPSITSIQPLKGEPGTEVTINGNHFSETQDGNIVKFGGVVAQLVSASTTQLKVLVPAGAASGSIVVIVNDVSVTSNETFEVLKSPIIQSFSPEFGTPGNTVTITGANFGSTPTENIVKFSGVTASITSASQTQLTVIVPNGASTGKISLTVKERSFTTTADFQVRIPSITNFTPSMAAPGAVVLINGTNFNEVASQNNVSFNGTSAQVTEATVSQLSVIVPNAALGAGTIAIEIAASKAVSSSDFTVVPIPSIATIDPLSGLPAASTGFSGTPITITGTGFNPNVSDNVVKFNGTVATVTDASTTMLKILIPAGATTGKITLGSYGVVIESTTNFTVLPNNVWNSLADYPDYRSSSAGFVIGTKIYVGTGYDGNDVKRDFWEFDTQTGQWTRKEDFPGIARDGAVGFSIGSKGYIGLGRNGASYLSDFYEYNPSTGWRKMKDFEGSPRSSTANFALESKGYVGCGFAGFGNYFNDFWEFDPANNDWSQVQALGTTGRYSPSVFVINSKAYVCGGRTGNTTFRDLWEFTGASGWTSKTQFPGETVDGAAGFSVGTNGYIANHKEVWKYSSTTNAWTQKAGMPSGLSFGIGLSVNYAAYFGVGKEDLLISKKFYKYIPD